MSRSLSLGNGSVLVELDKFGQVRDFYFDYVGLENHMSEEAVHRVGVWLDGTISWLNDGSWQIDVNYENETLVGQTRAVNNALEVELTFTDVVYNEKPIFVRTCNVKNLAQRKRQIKVFLNHQFRMYGTQKGDTVYFDPADNTIVHYKGRRVALIGGQLNKQSFKEYCVGLSNIEGKEGTWKDAEDGVLSKNPIEHGTVDSTICFEDTPDSEGQFVFSCWIAMGKALKEVKDLHHYILSRVPGHLTETTRDFWHAWLQKQEFDFKDLDPSVITLYKKSLLILRTHVDNTGGILASGDADMLQFGRDNYAYIWPRDGAFVAMALDNAGYHEVSRRFFEFANAVIAEEGYFFHKYRSDKSLGSSWHPWIVNGISQLPIQEDETSLVLYALWHHYLYTKDLEFIEDIYNSLIKRAANFMLGFRNSLKLPNPSYDLWEMKYGIHTFTAASVSAALTAAGNFANLLGKDTDEKLYRQGAGEVKEACLAKLYNPKKHYFYKLIDIGPENEILHDETIDASSFYALWAFGLLAPREDTTQEALKTLKDTLVSRDGIARFEGDAYYHSSDTPGNPWFVTTLWLAQYYIISAEKKEDLMEAKTLIDWAVKHAQLSGIMSEQINPLTGEQLSAAPLSWSHAEFITTIVSYIQKVEQLEEGKENK